MKRKTLHDESHNEDFYYESDNNGKTWHEVERERPKFRKCDSCGHGSIVFSDEHCVICRKSKWIDI